MRWKLLLLVISILVLWICPINDYVELNHLIIIDEVSIKCDQNNYSLLLREIIPKNKDNDIEYNYKTYKKSGDDLDEIIKELESSTNKRFYFNSIKKINTNCSDLDKIKNTFKINNKKIRIF